MILNVFFVYVSLFVSLTGLAKERIFVSFYPLEFAVRSLVGDQVDVWNPVVSDPADWQPSKAQIRDIQNCRMIIVNGAGFEKWTKIVSLPRSKLLVTTNAFKKDWLTYEGKKAHRHGNKLHVHKGFDGHTWMSPKRYLMQIEAIFKNLLRANLIDRKQLEQRYQKLRGDFVKLDASWKQAGQKLAKAGFVFANHPAYNYLAKDYGFKVKNFDISPDTVFTSEDRTEISQTLEKRNAKFFWWESSPRASQQQFIEKNLKLKSVVIAPGEIRGELNFLETMKQNVSKI